VCVSNSKSSVVARVKLRMLDDDFWLDVSREGAHAAPPPIDGDVPNPFEFLTEVEVLRVRA
jgi:hypothetical protein